MKNFPPKRIASFIYGVILILLGSTVLAQNQVHPSPDGGLYWRDVAGAAIALLMIVCGVVWGLLAILWKYANRILDLRLDSLSNEFKAAFKAVDHRSNNTKTAVETLTKHYLDRDKELEQEMRRYDLDIQELKIKLSHCKHHQLNGASQ